MASLWFLLLGIVALWVLPGAAMALVCLLHPRLRRRALQIQRLSVETAIAEYFLRGGSSSAAAGAWRRAGRWRPLQLMLIAVVLTLRGPLAYPCVREYARCRTEVRLE